MKRVNFQVMKTSAGKPVLGRLSLISTILLRPFRTNENVQLLAGRTQISGSRRLNDKLKTAAKFSRTVNIKKIQEIFG